MNTAVLFETEIKRVTPKPKVVTATVDPRVAVVIPFRTGSAGILGKNTKIIAGRRLWHWSWMTAMKAELVDLILVTTNDEPSLQYGRPDARRRGEGLKPTHFIRRPAELATEEAPLDAAIIHAIDEVNFTGTVVVLQPTVPVRAEGLVDECIRSFWQFPVSGSLVTVNRLHFVWDIGGRLTNGPRVNRQDMETSQERFAEDGSVFVTDSQVLRETGQRVVEPVLLFETARTVDIDTEQDWRFAEDFLLRL